MGMAKIGFLVGMKAQELAVKGMKAEEGQPVMREEVIGTGLVLMIALEGAVIHLPMTGTEAWHSCFCFPVH